MTVERTHADHQTRYELRDEAGLVCVLTYRTEKGGDDRRRLAALLR
jgi:hypothetical protein